MLGALSVTAVALAATGVLSLGGPARFGTSVQPHAGSGVAVPGSVRLLAVRTADPDGGPPWGMRTTRTTRGAVCLTVGRVVDGRLGALGIDGAFGDDDLLHPFTAGLFDPQPCAVPDADGHAFLSQAATGYPAAATGFYLVAQAGGCRASLQGLRGDCASSRLRDLYYGLLGPDAVSISYRTPSGAVRSEPTTGPDGAYLLVLPYRHGPKGVTVSGELTGMTGPIVKVGLRGGRVCRPAPTVNCGAIGERAPGAPELTARDVRAPVHVQAIHARAYCQSRMARCSLHARIASHAGLAGFLTCIRASCSSTSARSRGRRCGRLRRRTCSTWSIRTARRASARVGERRSITMSARDSAC